MLITLNHKLIFLLSLTILAVLMSAPMVFGETNKEKGQSPDVLIIYSTGTPLDYYTKGPLFRKIKKKTPKGVDAVTTATPMKENCRTIAEKLAFALRERELVVRVAEATGIKHRNEILEARLVIVGYPSRFGNVSWELKKLFDEQFSQIASLEDKGLANRRIAAFSMAEIEPSANGTLKAIRAAARDSGGRFGPTMIVLVKHSKKETQKRINQFADELAPLAKQSSTAP